VDELRGFKKLLAWQRADELAALVYRMSRDVAKTDRWLASQLARSAISVPANIAEGYGRGSLGDYLRFLDIARGSLAELEYHLHFVTREGLIQGTTGERSQSLHSETARLLTGLWQSLKAKNVSTWDHSGGSGRIGDERGVYWSDDDD
jgi:four helix bundle protein